MPETAFYANKSDLLRVVKTRDEIGKFNFIRLRKHTNTLYVTC